MPSSRKPSRRRPAGEGAVSRIETACRQAVAGKLAVRQLACWVDGLGVNETEFRLLWLLSFVAESPARRPEAEFDQAELAVRLAVSAAQVSGVVERLRAAGFVERGADTGDRRRQLWQLAPAGRALVTSVIAAVDALPAPGASHDAPLGSAGKDAA